MNSTTVATTRLIPGDEWPQHHPWPPIGGLRHLIFHAEKNGFSTVVKRLGRRVLIDEAAFFEWANRVAAPRKKNRRKAQVAA